MCPEKLIAKTLADLNSFVSKTERGELFSLLFVNDYYRVQSYTFFQATKKDSKNCLKLLTNHTNNVIIYMKFSFLLRLAENTFFYPLNAVGSMKLTAFNGFKERNL